MHSTILKQMDLANDFIWNKLFCKKTNLIYDCIYSYEYDERFKYLPSIEEIQANFPNPCGWGTGQEDCALSAGYMFEVLALRLLKGEDNLKQAENLVNGLYNCTFIHGNSGFLARGISPRDGKSCYSNSSRDQVSLVTSGLFRFLNSYPNASEEVITKAKDIVLSIANYCAKNITKENDYNYLRLDGKTGIVSKMWECDLHEVLRLPMIYITAYIASNEQKYLVEAMKYFEQSLSITESISESDSWWDIPLSQMQLSINFFIENEKLFPEYQERLKSLRCKIAKIAQNELSKLLDEAEKISDNWSCLGANWRNLKFRLQHGFEKVCEYNLITNNTVIFIPLFESPYKEIYNLKRGLGNYLSSIAIEPNFPIDPNILKRMNNLFAKMSFEKCCDRGTIALLFAYELLNKNRGVK